MRRRREGHDHLFHVVFGDHALEIPASAEHVKGRSVLGGRDRIAVEEADGLETELGVLEESLGKQSADMPGSHDQRRPESLAVTPSLRPGPVDGETPGGEIHGREATAAQLALYFVAPCQRGAQAIKDSRSTQIARDGVGSDARASDPWRILGDAWGAG